MPRKRHDTISGDEIRYAFAHFADDTGDVAAEDSRELHREPFLCSAAAHLEIDGVDAGGGNTDEDFAFSGLGIVKVLVLQVRRRTIFVENNCFHQYTSRK